MTQTGPEAPRGQLFPHSASFVSPFARFKDAAQEARLAAEAGTTPVSI